MLNNNQKSVIDNVIHIHSELHSITGMVKYAIIDDCMRKLEYSAPREDVLRHVNWALKDK